MSSQLEDDTRKVYDEFFEHAMHLLNDHQKACGTGCRNHDSDCSKNL